MVSASQSRLRIVPLDLATANRAVERWHRHHAPVVGHRWSLGVESDMSVLCGVAIAGHPVARRLDDGWTVEVLRVATDGTPNACSALYGAMKRVASAMGFERILTYTLLSEPGTSLRAAGWTSSIISPGGKWSTMTRPYKDTNPLGDKFPLGQKQRWECWLKPEPKRKPRLTVAFGMPCEGTLLEGIV